MVRKRVDEDSTGVEGHPKKNEVYATRDEEEEVPLWRINFRPLSDGAHEIRSF